MPPQELEARVLVVIEVEHFPPEPDRAVADTAVA
jgi:hypothetical protein